MIEVPARPPKFKLYGVRDLLAIPPPDWLIHNMIPAGSQVGLYGRSGDGKSFLALDWALSIATGREWHGRRVQQRRVVYVVAEGGGGVGKRINAWMRHHSVSDIDTAFFALEAVQMRNRDDVDTLLLRISELREPKPALVVLDTFARCFVGGEENSAKDVGEFVEAAARIQRFTGAAVLIVHHVGKGMKNVSERGSSALRAAADVMMMLRRDRANGLLVLENSKQKDGEEFPPIYMRLQVASLGLEPATGHEVSSCVVVPASEAVAPAVSTPNALETRLLEALASTGTSRLTSGEWRDAASTGLVIPETNFHRARRALLGSGYVRQENRHYCLTDKGVELLAAKTATTANHP